MAGCEVSVSIISSKVNVISTATIWRLLLKKKVKLEWKNKLNKNLQPIYSCNIIIIVMYSQLLKKWYNKYQF